MKQNLHIVLVLLFLGSFLRITAQDVNFTQYEMAPIFVNPANTGGFLGTYRIAGIFRDRDPSFPGTFTTLNLAIETNFDFAFRKKDWTALAITLLDDKSGAIGLGKGGFLASGGYHLVLGKGNLAIGAQFGGVTLSAKTPENAKFLEELNPKGVPNSVDHSQLNSAKASYNDISGGLEYTVPVGKKKNILKLGFAVAHLNKPSVTVAGVGTVNKLDRLLTASASLQIHMNNKTDIIPMIWSRNLSKVNETVPQCMLSYLFNEEKKVRLNAGLGYRLDDASALQILAGMDYGNIKAQVAYDVPTAVAGLEGFEIGVIYIGAVTKKPDPKPKVFCPRF